jgi:hypothetical protein
MNALGGMTVAIVLSVLAQEKSTLNDKVVEYARDHMGEKVGDGQCTSLAVEALRYAGAKVDPFRPDGDFVWGRQLDSPKEAKPGDILQFRDAVFKGRHRLPGGGIRLTKQTYSHHTAVVSEVKSGGKVLVILHQNIDSQGKGYKQTVLQGTINLTELQKGGWVRAYRPEAREEEKAEDEDAPFGDGM